METLSWSQVSPARVDGSRSSWKWAPVTVVVGAVGQRRVALGAGQPGEDVEVGLAQGVELPGFELVGVVDDEPAVAGVGLERGRHRSERLRLGLGGGRTNDEGVEHDQVDGQHDGKEPAEPAGGEPALDEHDPCGRRRDHRHGGDQSGNPQPGDRAEHEHGMEEVLEPRAPHPQEEAHGPDEGEGQAGDHDLRPRS